MVNRNVVLTGQQLAFVEGAGALGRFQTVSGALRELLAMRALPAQTGG